MPKKYKRSKSIPRDSPLTSAVKIPAKYNYDNIMKKHHLKHASIQFRNDLLRSKARASYQNEYDRVNSMLHTHILNQSQPNRELLVHRKDEMKRLALESLHPLQHEIYKGNN